MFNVRANLTWIGKDPSLELVPRMSILPTHWRQRRCGDPYQVHACSSLVTRIQLSLQLMPGVVATRANVGALADIIRPGIGFKRMQGNPVMVVIKTRRFDAFIFDLDEQMKTQASEAEARLQKLKQARDESWSALSAALADSRKAFDRRQLGTPPRIFSRRSRGPLRTTSIPLRSA